MNYPVLVFTLSVVVLWLSAQIGAYLHRRRRDEEEAEHEDLGVVLAASLTLLGLIIGFSFSMAVSRYDQRKNYEAEEANAIGTEYVRAGLLPAADATKVRELLRSYVVQRVLFYTTRNARQLEQIDASTAQLQTDLWSAVRALAAVQPTNRLQHMAIAAIRAHAAPGMRFHQAACVYPCEFNTSFMPETARATIGVGCAVAGA